MWIFFDQNNVYVTARCWESHPERMVLTEMRRDSTNVVQNENLGFTFDTFHDGRNSVVFEINAIGGRMDIQVTNERQFNLDWNPIWDLKVGRFDGGWLIEAAIPFKSLRYAPGHDQIWGFNARRVSRWKNEVSYLTQIPAALTMRGHFQGSLMATLVGLEAPSGSKNLEIKPYAISSLTSDRHASPTVSNDLGGDVGLDVKYGLTQNLTTDFTYNTDFAQVEADEQQVNLTRFNLFFPEKREFFLENQGTFAFGGATSGAFGPGPSGSGTNQVYGVDGTFAFYTNLTVNAYWAETRTTGRAGDDTSYRAQLDYGGDRFGVQLERLVVGSNFNPEVGFVRRVDMHKSYGQFRFSPRPRAITSVRKFSGTGSWTYVENGAGRLETRTTDGEFGIEFQNSDRFTVGATVSMNICQRPLRLRPPLRFRLVGTTSRASERPTTWEGSTSCLETCRSSAARFTTATRPRSA